jgi:hypothetical protein
MFQNIVKKNSRVLAATVASTMTIMPQQTQGYRLRGEGECRAEEDQEEANFLEMNPFAKLKEHQEEPRSKVKHNSAPTF